MASDSLAAAAPPAASAGNSSLILAALVAAGDRGLTVAEAVELGACRSRMGGLRLQGAFDRSAA